MDTEGISGIFGTEELGWKFTLFVAVSLGLHLWIILTELWTADETPWILVVALALGTFALAGPVRWTLYHLLSDSQLVSLGYVGVVLISMSVLLMTLYTSRWIGTNRMVYSKAVVLGVTVGAVIVVFLDEFVRS